MSQGFRKVIALFSLMLCPTLGFAQDSEPNKRALISDFNGEEAVGVFHIYEANPLNMEQGVRVELVDEDALGKPGGKALKIDYDVDSWQRSQIVIWFTLAEKDFSSYDTLHLSLKGQGPGGFRGNLPVRFVDSGNRTAPYVLSGIKGDWKHFQIPLKRFLPYLILLLIMKIFLMNPS